MSSAKWAVLAAAMATVGLLGARPAAGLECYACAIEGGSFVEEECPDICRNVSDVTHPYMQMLQTVVNEEGETTNENGTEMDACLRYTLKGYTYLLCVQTKLFSSEGCRSTSYQCLCNTHRCNGASLITGFSSSSRNSVVIIFITGYVASLLRTFSDCLVKMTHY